MLSSVRALILFVLVGSLGACASPQQRAINFHCEMEGMKTAPQVMVNNIDVNQARRIAVVKACKDDAQAKGMFKDAK